MTISYASTLLAGILTLLSFSSWAQTTQLRSQDCDATQPFTLGNVVLADQISLADQYQFHFNDSDTVLVRNSADYAIQLVELPLLSYGMTYDVYVRWRVEGGEWSAFGDTCQLMMADDIPTTQLRDSFCLEAEPFYLEAEVLADYVYGADSFHFGFSDGVEEFIYSSNNYSFVLFEAEDLEYGVTYNVYVRSIVNSDTSAWGDTCQIMISDMIPIVEVRDQFCDIDSLFALEATILCDYTAGYDAYKWQFIEDDDQLVYFSDNYSIVLDEVPGIGMGHIYQVRVAAVIGGSVGEYGDACTVSTSSDLVGSILEEPFCNTDTLLYFDDVITADTLSGGIDHYIFRIFGNGIDQEVESPTNGLDLSLIEGLLYDLTYNVTVQVEIMEDISLQSDTCNITFISQPVSITLTEESCDETYPLGSGEALECQILIGATAYEFRFSQDIGIPLIGTSINEIISISEVDGLLPGVYDVDVRGFAGEQWSEWGMTCPITIVDTTTALVENAYPLMSIYPNPSFDGRIVIDGLHQEGGVVQLQVLTLRGRSVIKKSFLSGTASVHYLELDKGTYILSIRGEKGVAVRRLAIR